MISPRVTKPARATFQKGVCGKCSRQKVCQRAIVRFVGTEALEELDGPAVGWAPAAWR